ncbi:hypothetical protein QE152_g28399 [Popillia japonica]|uniref:Endonuclease/exonuclease/phosphatase domain-containing protein n=1 Tax=Popillia japonica TaxID=7064 RepID=A0AAW1JK88_POPJA
MQNKKYRLFTGYSPPTTRIDGRRAQAVSMLKDKPKVLILADDQGRNSASILREVLGDLYQVQCVFKPKALLEHVISELQSIWGKLLEVESMLSDRKCDVFCVSETWSNAEQIQNTFKREEHIHGGVAIFVMKHVGSIPNFRVLSLCKEIDFEVCAVELVDYGVVVCCGYRSPLGVLQEFYDRLLGFLNTIPITKRIVFAADFNVDFAKNCLKTTNIINIFKSFGMRDTVAGYTRITPISKTRIDNIFTNIVDCEISVFDPCLSDHEGVCLLHKTLKKQRMMEETKSREIINDFTIENHAYRTMKEFASYIKR